MWPIRVSGRDGCDRRRDPAAVTELRDETSQIEWQRRHLQLPGPVVAPLRPVSISVDLDSVPVGIVQVESLADEMVRGAAERPAALCEANQGRCERASASEPGSRSGRAR